MKNFEDIIGEYIKPEFKAEVKAIIRKERPARNPINVEACEKGYCPVLKIYHSVLNQHKISYDDDWFCGDIESNRICIFNRRITSCIMTQQVIDRMLETFYNSKRTTVRI